jgi:hypothetical protein
MQQYFCDCVHVIWMDAEMDMQDQTVIELQLQDLCNPPVFITTPKVSSTGHN